MRKPESSEEYRKRLERVLLNKARERELAKQPGFVGNHIVFLEMIKKNN